MSGPVYTHHASEQRSEAWHKLRQGRITASIAPGCLALSPWHSPQKAWRMIRGEEPHVSNWYMDHGREMEPRAVQAYEAETGMLCQGCGFFTRDDYPWLGASPDRLVVGGGLLEVKVSRTRQGECPAHWRVQAQVQLWCTGEPWCDVYHWFDGTQGLWRIDRIGVEEVIRELQWYREKFLDTETPPRKGEVKRCLRK